MEGEGVDGCEGVEGEDDGGDDWPEIPGGNRVASSGQREKRQIQSRNVRDKV